MTTLGSADPLFVGGGHVPAFRTRQVTNAVLVRKGDTVALTGLLTRKDVEEAADSPLLRGIPLLGDLFRRGRFRNGETELVILLTPMIDAAGAATEATQQ